MPLSKLNVREYADLVNLEIRNYGTLFVRGLNGIDITDAEKTILLTAGEDYYGKEGVNYLYYFYQKIDANNQVVIDEFIRLKADSLERAIIPGLRQTTLTTLEYERITQIMDYKVLGGLWSKAWNAYFSLAPGEKKQVELAGKEMVSGNLIVGKPNAYLAFFNGQPISLNTSEQE